MRLFDQANDDETRALVVLDDIDLIIHGLESTDVADADVAMPAPIMAARERLLNILSNAAESAHVRFSILMNASFNYVNLVMYV